MSIVERAASGDRFTLPASGGGPAHNTYLLSLHKTNLSTAVVTDALAGPSPP